MRTKFEGIPINDAAEVGERNSHGNHTLQDKKGLKDNDEFKRMSMNLTKVGGNKDEEHGKNIKPDDNETSNQVAKDKTAKRDYRDENSDEREDDKKCKKHNKDDRSKEDKNK